MNHKKSNKMSERIYITKIKQNISSHNTTNMI